MLTNDTKLTGLSLHNHLLFQANSQGFGIFIVPEAIFAQGRSVAVIGGLDGHTMREERYKRMI